MNSRNCFERVITLLLYLHGEEEYTEEEKLKFELENSVERYLKDFNKRFKDVYYFKEKDFNFYTSLTTYYPTKREYIVNDNFEEHYKSFLEACFSKFKIEIMNNLTYQLKSGKIDYLQSIYEEFYRIMSIELKYGIYSLECLWNQESFGNIWNKLLPVRRKEISKFLEYLKLYYPQYLEKKFIERLEDNENKKPKTIKVTEPQCLLDIWNGEKSEYSNFILTLEKCLTHDDKKLLNIIDGEPKWEEFKGSIEYLAGFFRCCIDKGWIKDDYIFVAPKDKRILETTFNVSWKRTLPLQSIKSRTFKPKYLSPFIKLPSKKK
jgi:hypothetical protein